MESTTPLKLIVPLDGSETAEQALPAAIALAGASGEIRLISIVSPPDPFFDDVLRRYLPVTDQDHERRESNAHQSLVNSASAYGKANSHISFDVRTGDPSEEILNVAQTWSADMIVMASHGRGALDRWRFGSVADRIARSAAIPVMIIRADSDFAAIGRHQFNRLVLAHDGSELANRAVLVTVMLSRRLGLSVRVVRSIDPCKAFGGAMSDIPISESAIEQIEAGVRAEAGRSLEEVLRQLKTQGADAAGDVIVGPAGPALLNYAKPGDLLIVTSHGRGGVRRWVLGSVAEKLVRLAAVPVVLVPAESHSADPFEIHRK